MLLLQGLMRRCAATHPGVLTAFVTMIAILLAVPTGLGVRQVLAWFDIFEPAPMLAITALLVATPLAGFLALTTSWAWQLQKSLTHKEALLQSAQRLAKLGHWRSSPGSEQYHLSEDLCPLYGVTPDDPRLDVDRLLTITHADDRAALRRALKELRENHRPQELEYRIRTAEGGFRTIWIDGRCEHDDDGRVVALFGIMQDITERKWIEDDLRAALKQAEVANKAKSEFLANMSHELRTPLNAVLGFSEMIRDQQLGPVGNPRYCDYAGDIHDSGSHLLSLIDGLLDVAKIEAGRYELRESLVDLRGAIERAVRIMAPAAARSELRIERDIAHPSLMIFADEKALHQILLNLLSNAVKFSETGDVVRIRVAAGGETITLAVEDEGIGIPQDQVDKIGTPFFQAKTPFISSKVGTGIGLTVTRSLVELHGGSLTIASRYGIGTCVTVTLPASRLLPSPHSSAA